MKCKKVWVPEKNKVELIQFDFQETIQDPHDVILKSHYTHVSAGTELACLDGLESWFPFPNTPGYTSIAEIIDKGEKVPFEKGSLVYTYGPHSEYFKINITDRWHGVCVKLPDGINPQHAAFTHMAGIAMTSLRASRIELGDWVAVTGLGAIGNLAAQLAQLQGARVIGSDIEQERLALAKSCGIKYLINPSEKNPVEFIQSLSSGKGVSTLIDASGSSAVIEQMLDAVNLYGEVILLGSPRAPYQTNLTKTLQHFHLLPHCLQLKGALEFSYPTQPDEFTKHSIERNAAIILDLIHEGQLKIKPLHTHTLSPVDAPKAYEGLRNKRNEFVGVVFDWSN